MALDILYRGPLSSCNYDCGYCPFAKRHETATELKRDAAALARFIAWAGDQHDLELSVLFTPWGEALIRPWYQQALAELSRLPHLRRVAIQTNLSCRLDWLADCDVDKVNLWCTWHPSEAALDDFLTQAAELDRRGVRYSVGIVGVREAFDHIRQARERLPPHVYLWINALKDVPDYYSPGEVEFLTSIDPHFPTNLTSHASLGKHCGAGETAIAVDGNGDIRRCHFVRPVIGNIYQPDWRQALRRRACPNRTCGCHIGYVHLPHLGQRAIYGDGLLGRIPIDV
jgi:MoaA/NifB/PqqE/SkfB family radical SAM enzyme